jgi:hypothetical protein
MRTEVYDKLDWYDDPGVLARKTAQLNVLAQWLLDRGLVESYVRDYYKPPVDSDFKLSRNDLTTKGQKILDKHYNTWAEALNTDLTILDKALKEISHG